jgi:hypothetical protein
MSGWHSEDGIILFTGPGVKAGETLKDASIFDLTPTVLYLMGYPAARDMDGDVLVAAFDKLFLKKYPPEYVDSYESDDVPEMDQEEMDYKKTEERLKSLGYL